MTRVPSSVTTNRCTPSITGTPGPRDWYANVLADPNVTIHAPFGDFAGKARIVADEGFRRRVFTDPQISWYSSQTELEALVTRAPMIEIDLDMATDIRKAAASDDVADTLNYKAVANRVKSFIEDNQFELVETLAERIAGIITDEFDVPWVRVKLNKPGAIRDSRAVGVLIERGSRE